MNFRRRRGRAGLLALVTMATASTVAVGMQSAIAATATGYSGNAYGIGLFGVKVANAVTISDTKLNEVGPFNGPTPRSGDTGVVSIDFTASRLRASADTAQSSVTQGNGGSSASSTLQSADVRVGSSSVVRATVLRADTAVDCSGVKTLRTGVASLNVGGVDVNVNVSPNTTVTVRQPLTGRTIATVVINEQRSQTSPTYTEATANAVVVSFPANGALASVIQGQVVISHAESDVSCRAGSAPVGVSVGYADNYNGGVVFYPTPWEGDPGVVFVGSGCARGTQRTCDAGAVKVDNPSSAAVTARVTVDVGPSHYDLWGDRVIPPGFSLILTQTMPFNFDTSEDNPPGCDRSSTVPVVHVTINGATTDYFDTGQVLNTGGVEVDRCPPGTNEGQQWSRIS